MTTQPSSTSWRRMPLNMLLALLNTYGFSVAAFLLLRWLIGESWSLIALFNSVAHLLFLPALIGLPLALLLRRRATILLMLPALLAFFLGYGTMFVPRPVKAAPETPVLRVLTYNLKSQYLSLEPALAVIRTADADVVALQELSEEMAARLASDMIATYPYQATHTRAGSAVAGQGILSRYPIEDDFYWRIYQAGQRAALNIDGQRVVFYNMHPIQPIRGSGFVWHAEEIDDLMIRTAQERDPLILAGDFNMSDQSTDYWRVAQKFEDTYRAVGWGLGLTFPAMPPYLGNGRFVPSFFRWVPPLVRLDYVFHDAAFESLSARVWNDSGGSDHLPLYVELAMPG